MKLLTTLLLLTMMVGCAGIKTKTVARDADNNPIMRDTIFGGKKPVYDKSTKSRSAVIAEEGRARSVAASEATPLPNPCAPLMDKDYDTAAGQAEQARSFRDCIRDVMQPEVVAVALGRPTSDVEAIEQGITQQTEATEEGQTARTGLVTQPAVRLGQTGLIVKGAGRISDNQRAQSVAAAKYSGDTSTTINANQAIGGSSNDPSGAAGAGGMGPGGAAASTATTTSTIEGGHTFVVAGQDAANASDDGAANVKGNQQDIAASGNATQLANDARAASTQNNDNNNESPVNVDDADGSNNDPNLF